MIITSHEEIKREIIAARRARKPRAFSVQPDGEIMAIELRTVPGKPAAYYDGRKCLGAAEGVDAVTLDEAFATMLLHRKKRAAARQQTPAERREAAQMEKASRHTLNSVFDAWRVADTFDRRTGDKVNRAAMTSTRAYISVWGSAVRNHQHADRPLVELTKKHYREIIESAAHKCKPAIAHRAAMLVKQIAKYAADKYDVPPVVVPGMRDAVDGGGPKKSQPRQAVIDPVDFFDLFRDLLPQQTSAARALRVVMASGVRKSEATGAYLNEFTAAGWTIPGERMKQGIAHHVPTNAALLLALDGVTWSQKQHKDAEKGGLAFGTDRNGTASASRTLSAMTLNDILKRRNVPAWIPAKPERIPVAATIHDIRRSATSYMIAFCGIENDVAQAMIAHAPDTNKTHAAYNVKGFTLEQAIAEGWRAWADWFTKQVFTE
ncbi:hypothetical protein KE423_003915 [Salmonella enterica]|nr:hypothetical protein [Salmonella enterica]